MKIICTELLEQRGQDWYYEGRLLGETEKNLIYNGLDCMVTREIFPVIRGQLDPVTRATYEFSKELMGPILEMNMHGVLIDEPARKALILTYQAELDLIEDSLNQILNDGLGLKLNWRSNPALLNLFYNVLGLPPVKKRNEKGVFVPTVNREALEQLEEYMIAQPIISHLLFLRDRGKEISTLKSEVDNDGRLRTSYNIGGTKVGRLSSSFNDFGSGTNLQNIDHRLRKIFIADPGYKFGNIDLSQSDSRAVGAICWNLFKDGSYLDVCESGDLHGTVSKMVWPDKDPHEIFYRGQSYRNGGAKKLGHATNFMGGPQEVAKQTRVPFPSVKEFQRNYLAQFPVIPRWWEDRKQVLLNEGKLTTLLGRRRTFFGRRNDNQVIKEIISYEPASITADTLNRGLVKVWKTHKCQLLLQVHDSILFQFPEEQEDQIIPEMKSLIEQELELAHGRRFVIPADAQTGWNWAYATKDNPDGLKAYTGHDTRARINQPPKAEVMDRRIPRIHRELSIPRDLEEVDGDLVGLS